MGRDLTELRWCRGRVAGCWCGTSLVQTHQLPLTDSLHLGRPEQWQQVRSSARITSMPTLKPHATLFPLPLRPLELWVRKEVSFLKIWGGVSQLSHRRSRPTNSYYTKGLNGNSARKCCFSHGNSRSTRSSRSSREKSGQQRRKVSNRKSSNTNKEALS